MKALPLVLIGLVLSGCWSTAPQGTTPVQQITEQQIPTIHALGDSLTAGYQLPIQDSYPSQLEKILTEKWREIKVLNGGISWDTSEGLKKRIDRQLETAAENDIAILVIWANDGLRGLPLGQMKENIASITQTILDKKMYLIIWWMKIPLNNDPQYRADFEKVYTDLCATHQDNNKVSCMEFFLKDVWWIANLNLPDGIHPTKQWYSIIVNNLLPLVNDILEK